MNHIEVLDSTLTAAKVAIVAAGGVFASFLGWRLALLLALVVLMAMDYASGTWAARRNGEWKSSMARDGLWHKGGMVLVIGVCAMTDLVMLLVFKEIQGEVIPFDWPVVLFPIMTFWYILTETGSIIENAMKLGTKVPAWLPKILDATLKAVDAVGENAALDVLAEKAGGAPGSSASSDEDDDIAAEDLNADQLRSVLEKIGYSHTYVESLTREQMLAELDKLTVDN